MAVAAPPVRGGSSSGGRNASKSERGVHVMILKTGSMFPLTSFFLGLDPSVQMGK